MNIFIFNNKKTRHKSREPDDSHVNDAEEDERHSNDERGVGEPGAWVQAAQADLLYWEGEVDGEINDVDGVPGHQNYQDTGHVRNIEHFFFIYDTQCQGFHPSSDHPLTPPPFLDLPGPIVWSALATMTNLSYFVF